MTISSGSRQGPYEILSPLGTGGMGEVWRARDTRLERDVALKALSAELSVDPSRLERFEAEARAASALNHPNIVTIHEIGRTEAGPFIVMELVEGKTLRELLYSGAFTVRRALHVATQLSDGLARAHEAGIVHRDLKPENVMLGRDGLVKMLDFGLAKVDRNENGGQSRWDQTVTEEALENAVVGTAGYMSPEQASGQAVDFRSDQFSFGALVYEMLSGHRAFHRATRAETLTAVIREEPEPLDILEPRLAAPLRWIVERCLAKLPDDRYVSTRDLARDLQSIRDHFSQVEGPGESARLALLSGAKRSKRMLSAGLALAALIGSAYFLGRRVRCGD